MIHKLCLGISYNKIHTSLPCLVSCRSHVYLCLVCLHDAEIHNRKTHCVEAQVHRIPVNKIITGIHLYKREMRHFKIKPSILAFFRANFVC